MFAGRVTFKAEVSSLRFNAIEVKLPVAGVEKVALEASKSGILLSVYLSRTSSKEEAVEVAKTAAENALNRLAITQEVAVGKPVLTSEELAPIDAMTAVGLQFVTPGVAYVRVTAHDVNVVRVNPPNLKEKLERVSPPGESYFGDFRTAMSASNDTDRFLSLYRVLLMLRGDAQAQVDNFIRSEEPGVPHTPSPRTSGIETVYTRLRNELAHPRTGASLEETRREASRYLHGLMKLVKRAIELQS